MVQNTGAPKEYSGWVLVIWGAVVAAIGAGVIALLSLAHVTVGGGRLTTLLLLSVPVGLVLIVVGLVYVARRKTIVDDSAERARFEALNRRLLREQRADRRAARVHKKTRAR